MAQTVHSLFNLRTGWLVLVVINFIFGICGIIMCSLKLKHGSEEAREDFFKLSIIFATCNLILSVLLLVSVIKNNQKYAFLCAFLSFLSLFSAVIHIESSTTSNLTFIIIFVVVGVLFLFWFCIFAAYQVLYQRKQAMEDENMSPIWTIRPRHLFLTNSPNPDNAPLKRRKVRYDIDYTLTGANASYPITYSN